MTILKLPSSDDRSRSTLPMTSRRAHSGYRSIKLGRAPSAVGSSIIAIGGDGPTDVLSVWVLPEGSGDEHQETAQ